MGVQTYSFWHASTQRQEDYHGPHNCILPQSGLHCQRPCGQEQYRIHSRKDQRFICTQCRKTFTATKGTAFYRLRTSTETVTLVVTLMAHGCPLQAIVVVFGFDERTVAS